jgi:hypothetical protein
MGLFGGPPSLAYSSDRILRISLISSNSFPPVATSTLILLPFKLFPSMPLTASRASLSFLKYTKAKPGGFLATQTSSTSP